MARLTRHQMKRDELSARLAAGMEFFEAHKKRILLAVPVLLGVLVVGLGINYYIRNQQAKAAAAFAKALHTYHSPVITNAPAIPDLEWYKTNEEKNQRALEQFNAVAAQYSRYAVGRLARYYAAICLRELGRYPEAEKEFQALVGSRDTRVASLSKLGLASVYELTDRAADAERLYKELEERPSESVPKATALLARADLYARTNPTEATNLYQQIQKDFPGTQAAEYAGTKLSQLSR